MSFFAHWIKQLVDPIENARPFDRVLGTFTSSYHLNIKLSFDVHHTHTALHKQDWCYVFCVGLSGVRFETKNIKLCATLHCALLHTLSHILNLSQSHKHEHKTKSVYICHKYLFHSFKYTQIIIKYNFIVFKLNKNAVYVIYPLFSQNNKHFMHLLFDE